MSWILEVATVDPGDGAIKVVHRFYGKTKEECDTYLDEHLDACEYFEENSAAGMSFVRYTEAPLLTEADLEGGGWEQLELDGDGEPAPHGKQGRSGDDDEEPEEIDEDAEPGEEDDDEEDEG